MIKIKIKIDLRLEDISTSIITLDGNIILNIETREELYIISGNLSIFFQKEQFDKIIEEYKKIKELEKTKKDIDKLKLIL